MKNREATIGAALICVSAALWGVDGVVLTPRLSNLSVPFVVFLLHAIPHYSYGCCFSSIMVGQAFHVSIDITDFSLSHAYDNVPFL